MHEHSTRRLCSATTLLAGLTAASLAGCTDEAPTDPLLFGPQMSEVSTDADRLFAPRPADLVPSLISPAAGSTNQVISVQMRVQNVNGVGQPSAANVVAQLALPAGTSPGTLPSGCTRPSPSIVRCTYGTLLGGYSATRTIPVTLPAAAGAVTFSISASTTSNEPNQANNQASRVVSVAGPAQVVAIAPPQTIELSSCFAVTTFAQCHPAAIESGILVLDPGGNIQTGTPDVTGEWSQPTGSTSIRFVFRDAGNGQIFSQFDGAGVSATCWEGGAAATGAVGAFRACTL